MAKILLVEDESIILLVLAEVLADAGHQVIEATNGVGALTSLEPGVDVFVSDLMMPRMSGFEWVAAARERAGYKETPVIFMSALPPPPAARNVMSAFLSKPFRPLALVETVEALLRETRMA